jgi:hypothetical protein
LTQLSSATRHRIQVSFWSNVFWQLS